MKRNRHYRRRRMRTGTLILVLSATVLLLVSCVAGSNALWIRGLFGWDLKDYLAESTEQTLCADSPVTEDLIGRVRILLSNRIELEEFRTTSEAVELYRDAILNDMLREHYSIYTGNANAIQAAASAYAHSTYLTLIPAEDFENTVFRYFGGTTVRQEGTQRFPYLDRVESYTTAGQAKDCKITVLPSSVEETASTYRMRFSLSDGTDTQDGYTAVFVKRDDGSCYWKSLLRDA